MDDVYATETVKVLIRRCSNGSVDMTIYGKCERSGQSWRRNGIWRTADGAECCVDDVARLLGAWVAVGSLGAMSEPLSAVL
jgi:hypothetical protein